MKAVNVYGVSRKDRTICGDMLELHEFRVPSDEMMPALKVGSEFDGTVVRSLVPVLHFVENGKDSFIAIEPRLRDMLLSALRPEFAKQLDAIENQARAFERGMEQYREYLGVFNAMPWYLRVWRAWRQRV